MSDETEAEAAPLHPDCSRIGEVHGPHSWRLYGFVQADQEEVVCGGRRPVVGDEEPAMLTEQEKDLREWLRGHATGGHWWMVVKAGFRRSFDLGVESVTKNRVEPPAVVDAGPACTLLPAGHRHRVEPVAPMTAEWTPGRWWRAIAPDGSLWCESSDEAEVRRAARPGDTICREWVRDESEWRDA